MQAFKLYFKIVRKSVLLSISIYFVIFSIISIISSTSFKPIEDSFVTSKSDVAIINNDSSEMSDSMVKFISENSNIVDIKSDDESIRDALFFREADYILIIPNGFGDGFIAGNSPQLETMTIPNSTNGMFVDFMVNNYLNTVKLYIDGNESLDFDTIVSSVKADMDIETNVNIADNSKKADLSAVNYFFNFTAYPFICIIILGVSMVMIVVNDGEIRRRNNCSPIKSAKFNLQIFAGNAVFALCVWFFFMLYALVLCGKEVLNTSGLLLMLNALVFVISILSLSFLIGNIASKNAIQPLSNIISLGGCFLGGAFVPQSMLSDTVKTIAIINPTFWFIKANDTIGILSVFNFSTLKDVFFDMGIMLIFSVVFLIIGLIVARRKMTSK